MTAPLADDLASALDPAVLAERIGFVPDPWQLAALRSQAQRLCLLCSRQAGKSTVSAVLALHKALYSPGSLILLFAPSQRQAVELFRTITRNYRLLGRPVAAEAENSLSLTLENGSRVIALPGDEKTVRGYANAKLIIIDEAALVDDELYRSIRPMLAVSRGRLIALSTPRGRRGWFHDAATSKRGWEVVRVTASECPRITQAVLEEERADLGDWMFRQEYNCEFLSSSSTYFDPADIAALSDGPVAVPLFGGAA